MIMCGRECREKYVNFLRKGRSDRTECYLKEYDEKTVEEEVE